MKRFYKPKLLAKRYADFSSVERRFRTVASSDPDLIAPLLMNLADANHESEEVAQGMMDAVMRGLQGTPFDDVRYATAKISDKRWRIRIFNLPQAV